MAVRGNKSGPASLIVATALRGDRAGPAVSPFAAVSAKTSAQAVTGAMKAISLSGPSSYFGDGTFGRELQVGAMRNDAEGNPGIPSLQLDIQGFWRFRWSVKSGTKRISCLVKQPGNIAPYPSMIIKANSAVGLAADATATSTGGTGWVTIGPLTLTFTAAGVVWVELWNNTLMFNTPAYFDHIVTT